MKRSPYLSILLTTPRGCRVAKACAGVFGFLVLAALIMLLSSWWSVLRLVFSTEATTFVSADTALFAVIPQAHLFGQSLPSSLATLPLTTAPLKLTGIIQVTNEQQEPIFKALIAVEGGSGKSYQEGDILPGGLKVATINAEAVFLDQGGRLERLPLQRLHVEKNTNV